MLFIEDWYRYLTIEFKRPRDSYTVQDKAVFDCPKCGTTSISRINHVKEKIKRLGFFICSKCRKTASINKARLAYRSKYGLTNPFELDFVKEKIKASKKKNGD